MVNYKTIISALALLALAVAVAVPFPSNTSFSIKQVAVKVPPIPPAAVYARAYARLGVKVPDYVALAARNGWTESVTATPVAHDVLYLTPIKIGANTLQVLVDSGSGNLWAYTPQTPAVGSHATYNPQTGTVLEGFYWEVINGQGVITQGRVVLDKVSVGRLTSPLQAVQLVDSIEPISAMHNPMRAHDGVLGIALSKRNAVRPIKQRTFFDNIKNNLAAPLIAAYIKHGAPGTYDIGWIDTTNIGGDFSSSTPFFAVVDTGASLILLQNSIVAQYYDKIPGAYISPVRGGYVFPCTDTDIIPDFTLNLGEFNTTIPGYLLKYATYGDHCFGGIQISPVPSYNFLGDVFLKRHYVIFSSYSHGPRIGIAAQA
ncbi:hypothetical protein EYB25_003015 [Talaromyces marneffei]|uniref:uncharacterized protein n=1 Tax=Talaromyces marneffei TaxID=37727 RepID=UPI0012A8100D|nr:uncharacterized protein EYB26_005519 [Talaromyces marneffei]KAE8554476.1 hypothetical protein EYB25_003015 [Talaromyces marneffei]QGA17843.1 hypothetical protein EYB26_005519 [Talaromyces marneffei]